MPERGCLALPRVVAQPAVGPVPGLGGGPRSAFPLASSRTPPHVRRPVGQSRWLGGLPGHGNETLRVQIVRSAVQGTMELDGLEPRILEHPSKLGA